MPPVSLYTLVMLIGSCIVLFACATGPEVDLVIHTSPHGMVSLERIHDRSFQAAHPIRFPPETIDRVLRGLLVKPTQRTLQTLIVGEPDATRVFTDEDLRFLAPLLAEGLARAASDQQVGFRVSRLRPTQDPVEVEMRSHPGDTVSGSLYAYGRSLYVTLSRIRPPKARGEAPARTDRGIPDLTGLANHVVTFTPTSAQRPENYRNDRSTNATVIIDYELLASSQKETIRSSSAGAPPNRKAEPPKTSPAPPTRETEIEALRQELREIKKRLAEQEAGQTDRRLITPPTPR